MSDPATTVYLPKTYLLPDDAPYTPAQQRADLIRQLRDQRPLVQHARAVADETQHPGWIRKAEARERHIARLERRLAKLRQQIGDETAVAS